MDLAAIMAADPSEIYEPWQPQIGDRVRVRLSGECPRRWHSDDSTGAVGMIRFANCGDHPYRVELDDEPQLRPGRRWESYAACELEPLDRDVPLTWPAADAAGWPLATNPPAEVSHAAVTGREPTEGSTTRT